MTDLAQWLAAQLDADEADARLAGARAVEWHIWEQPLAWGDQPRDAEILAGGKPIVSVDAEYGPGVEFHIERHDPAFVLADITAKRALIAEHAQAPATAYLRAKPDATGCRLCHLEEGYVEPYGWCQTLRLLAAAYASRPG